MDRFLGLVPFLRAPLPAYRTDRKIMGQNRWYHFGVGEFKLSSILGGDWDVHWGYDSFDPWPESPRCCRERPPRPGSRTSGAAWRRSGRRRESRVAEPRAASELLFRDRSLGVTRNRRAPFESQSKPGIRMVYPEPCKE